MTLIEWNVEIEDGKTIFSSFCCVKLDILIHFRKLFLMMKLPCNNLGLMNNFKYRLCVWTFQVKNVSDIDCYNIVLT